MPGAASNSATKRFARNAAQARFRNRAAPQHLISRQSSPHIRGIADAIRAHWTSLQERFSHRAGSDGLMMVAGIGMLLLYRQTVDGEEQRMREQVFMAVLDGLAMIKSTARSELTARGGPAPSAVTLAGAFSALLVSELTSARAKLHESWLSQYGPRIGSASLTATASVLEGIASPFTVEWLSANCKAWVPSRRSRSSLAADDETGDEARNPVLTAEPKQLAAAAAAAGDSASIANKEELVLVMVLKLVLGRIRSANKRRDRQVTSTEWLSLLQLGKLPAAFANARLFCDGIERCNPFLPLPGLTRSGKGSEHDTGKVLQLVAELRECARLEGKVLPHLERLAKDAGMARKEVAGDLIGHALSIVLLLTAACRLLILLETNQVYHSCAKALATAWEDLCEIISLPEAKYFFIKRLPELLVCTPVMLRVLAHVGTAEAKARSLGTPPQPSSASSSSSSSSSSSASAASAASAAAESAESARRSDIQQHEPVTGRVQVDSVKTLVSHQGAQSALAVLQPLLNVLYPRPQSPDELVTAAWQLCQIALPDIPSVSSAHAIPILFDPSPTPGESCSDSFHDCTSMLLELHVQCGANKSAAMIGLSLCAMLRQLRDIATSGSGRSKRCVRARRALIQLQWLWTDTQQEVSVDGNGTQAPGAEASGVPRLSIDPPTAAEAAAAVKIQAAAAGLPIGDAWDAMPGPNGGLWPAEPGDGGGGGGLLPATANTPSVLDTGLTGLLACARCQLVTGSGDETLLPIEDISLLRNALATAIHHHSLEGGDPDTASEMESCAASLVNVARCLMVSGAWSAAGDLLKEVMASPTAVSRHPSIQIDLLSLSQIAGSHESLDIWQGLIRVHSRLVPRVRVAAAELLWQSGLQEQAIATVQVGNDSVQAFNHHFVGSLSALLLKMAPPVAAVSDAAPVASKVQTDSPSPSADIACLAKLGSAGLSLLGRRFHMHRQMQTLLQSVGVGRCLRLMCGMMEGMALTGESAAISSSLAHISLVWQTRAVFSRVKQSPDVRSSPLARTPGQRGKQAYNEEAEDDEGIDDDEDDNDDDDDDDDDEVSLGSDSDDQAQDGDIDDGMSEHTQAAASTRKRPADKKRPQKGKLPRSNYQRTLMRLSMSGPEATIREIANVGGQPTGTRATVEQSMTAWTTSYERLVRSKTPETQDEGDGLMAAATRAVSSALLGVRRCDSPHIAPTVAPRLDSCRGEEPFATLEWMQSLLQPDTWKAVSSAELPLRSQHDATAAKLDLATATAWYRACLGVIGVATEAMMRHSGGTIALARASHRLAMEDHGAWPMQSLAMAASHTACHMTSDGFSAKLRSTLLMARGRALRPGDEASQATRPGALSSAILLSQASAGSGDFDSAAKNAQTASKQFATWPAAILQQAAADADRGIDVLLDGPFIDRATVASSSSSSSSSAASAASDSGTRMRYEAVQRLEQQAREAKASLTLHAATAKAQEAIDHQLAALTSTTEAARIMRQRSAATSGSESSSSGFALRLPDLKRASLDACAAFNKGRSYHAFGAVLEAEEQYRQALLLCDRADADTSDKQDLDTSAVARGKRQRSESVAAWGSVRVRASAGLMQLLTAQGRLGEARVVGEALVAAPNAQRPNVQIPPTQTVVSSPMHVVYRLPGWRPAAQRQRTAKPKKSMDDSAT